MTETLVKTESQVKDDNIVLRVKDLHTYFYTVLGVSKALNGVSFENSQGKTMGVVGESGCGKSVTALSIMALVPRQARLLRANYPLSPTKGSNGTNTQVEEVLI